MKEQLARTLMTPASGSGGRLRASAALDYPFTPPQTDGSVVEVADGLLWARMPMPMALDHINVYLLRGETGWTLVDTGLNTADCRARWESIAVEHLQGLPIEALICTHFHYDHAGLAPWITERFGVPLFMTLGEFMTMKVLNLPMPDPVPPEQIAFYQRAGLPELRLTKMFEALAADPFTPPPMPAYQRLRGGQVLRIGNREWTIIIGEGHSPEHACLYCEAEGILIAGDQLLPRISSNVLVSSIEPEGNPLQQWFDSLDRLEVCRPDTLILPSHQNVYRGLHLRTQELREHHLQQFAQLLGALEQQAEFSAFEAMNLLFKKLRHPMDDMLALGETLAHLAWLLKEGRLQRRLAEDGLWRYSREPGALIEKGMHW